MLDVILFPANHLKFLYFNSTYNFAYGAIIIGIVLGIIGKSISFYKETHQKKILFFATMFFISVIFEVLHISSIFNNPYVEFLNVFFNRFYASLGLLGILFIRENPPGEKFSLKDFKLPIWLFAIVLLFEILTLFFPITRSFFPNLLNSLTAFLFISILSGFIFIKILEGKKILTVFDIGIFLLAISGIYIINEHYYSSGYRHLVHMFRLLGNLFILLDMDGIKEDLHFYRFRLKMILLPNLYMIMSFITFVILGDFIFNILFSEQVYLAFIIFYCICLILQFVFVSGFTQPITDISQALIAVKPEEKPKLIKIIKSDEIGILAENINQVLTRQWEYTTEINENQKKIKDLMRSRDTFIASLSHDLKAPIFSEQKIIEFILMDRDAIKISDFIEYLEEMYQINDEILRIVNNILTAYHMDSNEFELNLVPTNINTLIKSSSKTLAHLAKDENIELILELDSNIPLIKLDEDMIRRVIVNLISNGIKHSKNSNELKISSKREKHELIISVQDFGKGITAEDQKNIFQKYPTVKRKIGTGLGLYISKQIITAHKGKIWFESKVDKGTTFYFSLPI